MEQIQTGDRIRVLVERDRLNRDELISGKGYYIWELEHRNRVIVRYDDIDRLVHDKEAAINKYINLLLVASAVFFFFVYIRRFFKRSG